MACCVIMAGILGLILSLKTGVIAVARKGRMPEDPRAWKPEEKTDEQ
jgi:hypothetical protein